MYSTPGFKKSNRYWFSNPAPSGTRPSLATVSPIAVLLANTGLRTVRVPLARNSIMNDLMYGPCCGVGNSVGMVPRPAWTSTVGDCVVPTGAAGCSHLRRTERESTFSYLMLTGARGSPAERCHRVTTPSQPENRLCRRHQRAYVYTFWVLTVFPTGSQRTCVVLCTASARQPYYTQATHTNGTMCTDIHIHQCYT